VLSKESLIVKEQVWIRLGFARMFAQHQYAVSIFETSMLRFKALRHSITQEVIKSLGPDVV
jgi:hypothetical protein